MLHRLRSVLVRAPRSGAADRGGRGRRDLHGRRRAGLRGGHAKGKKLLVGIAVERIHPRGLGRCRMAVLPDATTETPRAVLAAHVEEGATVVTDGWQAHRQANAGRYIHRRQPPPPAERRTRLCPASTESPRWRSVAAGHPPGVRGRRPPAQLPRRVRLPVRPSKLAQPRPRLLPRPRTRRHPPARALPRSRAQPPVHSGPATTAPALVASHRPWTAHPLVDRGGPLTSPAPVRWIPPSEVTTATSRRLHRRAKPRARPGQGAGHRRCVTGQSPWSRARTTRLVAGMFMRADESMPCIGAPSASTPPPFVRPHGFG
jgi:hypothetical protein